MPGPVSQSNPSPDPDNYRITCAFCGHHYDDPDNDPDLLAEHINVCPKHPIFEARKALDAAMTLLWGITHERNVVVHCLDVVLDPCRLAAQAKKHYPAFLTNDDLLAAAQTIVEYFDKED